MSDITSIKIQEKDKNRCNIFLDGEYSFSLSYESVLQNRLKVGVSLNDNQIALLKLDDQKATAMSKGLAYVSKAMKTKKQVVNYLLGKEYSSETVYHVVDRLVELGFINDIEFAKRYIECSSGKGKRLLENALYVKGISKNDFENAYYLAMPNDKEKAFSVLQKYMKSKESSKENFAKAYRYLVGKGFSYDEIESAMSRYKEELRWNE